MSKKEMFALGALGGALPILASLVTVDLAPIIDHASTLTIGNYIGYSIRVIVLLFLGGVVAVLNSEVQQPLTLVQLGIAAPALITSYINSTAPPPARTAHAPISIVTLVLAEESNPQRDTRVVGTGGFIRDIINGIGIRTDRLDSLNRKSVDTVNQRNAIDYPNTGAPAPTPAEMGSVCTTPQGRFGPGPMQPIGTACNVNTPDGVFSGQVTK